MQQNSPFLTANQDAYESWKKWKLEQQPAAETLAEPVVVHDPAALTQSELDAIRERVRATNWVLFRLEERDTLDQDTIKQFASQLGLKRLDANLKSEQSGVSAICVKKQEGTPYIPYTSRQISWHTDGYYNDSDEQIYGMLLYCVKQAAEGGSNDLMDHELLYMMLRDEDPTMIDALMHPQAMTIPANIENGVEIRPDHTGPVFSIGADGNLHMRYSARTRNISWRDDADTQRAAARIVELMNGAEYPVIHHHMQPGEGVICNNVLHRRDAFRDGDAPEQQRLLYRARFSDRIAETGYQNR
ncbi:TauD/TfdA family dioxygenase [Solemya elarraichensis gill symbiont]|uniref:TauD/TfdA-like domain-containing protein n=1 Tax=Solemya elarraichensis gill symbiont TaxID=1918949 RepID=A0A1T2LDL8_9GAMM|nr:TauD/TfdA family dioxygenase [Solemya elarraichensis gill symbiont]OOZ43046.1 hypothetical protein BOW52_00600 [Solemya elarraichensis gill symbiont]